MMTPGIWSEKVFTSDGAGHGQGPAAWLAGDAQGTGAVAATMLGFSQVVGKPDGSTLKVDRFTWTAPGMSPTRKQLPPCRGIGFPGYVTCLTYPMSTLQ